MDSHFLGKLSTFKPFTDNAVDRTLLKSYQPLFFRKIGWITFSEIRPVTKKSFSVTEIAACKPFDDYLKLGQAIF